MHILADMIKLNLEANGGKIAPDFIDNLAEDAEKIYLHPTDNTRICVMKIYSGHEVVGIAQVLDAKNDVEEIGNSVAYENAKQELWKVCGNIAKIL
jgi:hypothetical protein